MCWQDVQIARQNTVERKAGVNSGGTLTINLPQNLRRSRIIVTGSSSAAAPTVIPSVTIGAIGAFGPNDLFIAADLYNPVIMDMNEFGREITGPLEINLVGDSLQSTIVCVVMQLNDPEDLGNPITGR